jgi:DNA-binding transcriptional LysR family regulator
MAAIDNNVAGRATIDLNHVATWVRVVDCGSFTAAARALGLPKSSVSRAIARLEEELGLALLQRTTRKLTLTRAGERYLATAREALRSLDEARVELMEEDKAVSGLVRLTAPFDSSTRLGAVLAESIVEFLQRYPDVFVDMVLTARQVDLVAEGVDFAIRAGKLDDSTLIARRIKTDQLVLAASPAYLKEHGTPRRFADLAQHRMILHHAPLGSTRLRMTGPHGPETVAVRGQINIDEMGFALPLAEAGAGIAMIPLLLAHESVQVGRIVRVLSPYARKDAAVYLVHPPQRNPPRRVVMLRDHVYETLTRELARCSGMAPELE